MILLLQRFSSGPHSTLGNLFVDGTWECFTLEDEARAVKVPGDTRIPAGTYDVTLRTEGGFHSRYKERFAGMHKGMLWIRDVPDFEFILIHCGNYEHQTDGCLLVGNGAYQNRTGKGMVQQSEYAYRRIYPPIATELEAGSPVTLEIEDYA